MIEDLLGIERGYMAEREVEIEIIEEDLIEIEVGKDQSGNFVDLISLLTSQL